MKLKPLIYYISLFIMIAGVVQFFISLLEVRKMVLLKTGASTESGVVIDKFIQERFQGPQTGYRLRFANASLNALYESHFFKSYNDKYNKDDTLCVLHYNPDPEFSCLCNFRDAYSSGLISILISISLLLAGWIGIKKCATITNYLKGQ